MIPRELAADVCRQLQSSGFQAYLVGGCVRDLLLGREPEDYDVATDAHPARVQELFPSSVDVGAKFGVILVVADGAQVEVATFRSDLGYSDGRHPDRVEYSSSPEQDVLRRDFTINGMMLDPQTEANTGLRRRTRGPGTGDCPRDWRPGRPFPRRPLANGACRPLRSPLWLRH